jgi:hypothetical protein
MRMTKKERDELDDELDEAEGYRVFCETCDEMVSPEGGLCPYCEHRISDDSIPYNEDNDGCVEDDYSEDSFPLE